MQLLILKRLLYNPTLRYSEMKPDPEMGNNKFDFHLNRLVKAGYVSKSGTTYLLTDAGKELAGRMDTDRVIIEKQAKIGVFVAPIREDERGRREFLIYTRLKQPFYGCQGFLSGKIGYGEEVLAAAARELFEETGLLGTPEITSVRHYIVYDASGSRLLEDKIIFFCRVINPNGEIKHTVDEKYEWVEEKNASTYVVNHFESSERFLKDIQEITKFSGQVSFFEVLQKSDNF